MCESIRVMPVMTIIGNKDSDDNFSAVMFLFVKTAATPPDQHLLPSDSRALMDASTTDEHDESSDADLPESASPPSLVAYGQIGAPDQRGRLGRAAQYVGANRRVFV